MKLFDLSGKRALITGGTHGLGMAMAKGLGEAGAQIIINDVLEEKLKGAIQEYKQAGFDVKGYRFDVTNDEAVGQAIQTIEKEVGPIDILINNAGIIKRTPMVDMEASDFRQVIEV